MVNPFYDIATITREYRPEAHAKMKSLTDARRIWQDADERFHSSAGIGGKIHMNTNFILSLEVAKGFNPQLSDLTVAMATTYLF